MFHMLTPFARLAAAAFLICSVSTAHAGDFLFQLDNDKVVDTDRHYTNGVRVAYTMDTPFERVTNTSQALAKILLFQDGGDLRTGWVFGQDMYTPEDVDTYAPDPLDRPYAGWLYGGLSAQQDLGNRQDTYEFNVGIIGPSAKAGQTQNSIHRVLNVSVSHGWRSQIGHEIGIQGTRMLKLRTEPFDIWGLDSTKYDFIGHGTAQLGNVRTGAALGGTVRLGGNLAEDFGPVYGIFALPQKRPKSFTWSVFLGGEARAVARDIFLDGNSFRNSPDVKKEPYVFEGRVGFAVHAPFDGKYWLTGARLSVNMVQRSREFQAQNKADRYGSVQLTLNF